MQPPDCEQIHHLAWLAQPVNAWSSLAFALAGALILVRAVRGDHGRTPELAVFALAVGMNSVGSFLFHGFRGDPAHWAHDLCIYAVLAFVAIHAFGTVRAWPRRTTLGAFAVAVAILGIARWAAPAATDVISGLLTFAAVVGESFAWRAGLRPRRSDGPTLELMAWTLVLLALGLGGLSFLFGSNASPLCRPNSLFQWHAVWHVLLAAVLVAYAYAAVELWSPADSLEEVRRHLGNPDAKIDDSA